MNAGTRLAKDHGRALDKEWLSFLWQSISTAIMTMINKHSSCDNQQQNSIANYDSYRSNDQYWNINSSEQFEAIFSRRPTGIAN